MKIKALLANFLYDKKYFITIFENKVHVFQYRELLKLAKDLIEIKMQDFNLKIIGNDLYIKQMTKDELLIEGLIKKVEKIYE